MSMVRRDGLRQTPANWAHGHLLHHDLAHHRSPGTSDTAIGGKPSNPVPFGRCNAVVMCYVQRRG